MYAEQATKRYHNNRDSILEKKKSYYQENKEDILAKTKLYYDKNKEVIAQYQKEYKHINRELLLTKYREYSALQSTKERRNKRDKNRKERDIQYKLSCALRTRMSQAIRNDSKVGSAVTNLGCSIEDLKKYLESLFQPEMTWENYGEWQIDHIKPLIAFDLTDIQQIKIVCHYTNLRPLWKADNINKRNLSDIKMRGIYARKC